MSQRMFEELDRLERGARIESRPTREQYNDSSTDFSAYEGNHASYCHHMAYHDGHEREPDAFIEQPLTFDSFGLCHLYTSNTEPC